MWESADRLALGGAPQQKSVLFIAPRPARYQPESNRLGLENDYDHDGWAIFEVMTHDAIPLLTALASNDTTTYEAIEDALLKITKLRNDIASQSSAKGGRLGRMCRRNAPP